MGLREIGAGVRNVRVFFATLACLVGGGLLISGAYGIAEEVPYHVGIGVGFAVFGVLLGLVLALQGATSPAGRAAYVRAKGLLGFLVTAIVAGGAAYVLVPEARTAWALAERGRTAVAQVVQSSSPFSKRPRCRVRFDGHVAWLETRAARGSRVRVVYDADDKDLVVAGDRDTFAGFLDRSLGRRSWLCLAAAGLVCALAAPFALKRLLLGAPVDERSS